MDSQLDRQMDMALVAVEHVNDKNGEIKLWGEEKVMKIAFGIDLGGTTVKIAVFDGEGGMLTKWEIPTGKENGGEKILPDIAHAVEGYIAKENIDRADVVGIGIGVPGPVDRHGVVNKCVNLGWGVLNVEKTLADLTGFAVKAANDASVAALGECWEGGGKGCENMVFVTLGTGVGGGIVVGGQLVYGAHGAGGEVGHMTVNREETALCGCGKRGCLEQYGSATGIVRLAKTALAEQDTPSSLRHVENLTCKDVFDAAKAGDALAAAVLEQVYAYLGEGIANICDVTDPEAVVLGGGVSKAGQMLLDGVERHFKRHVFHGVSEVQFRLAELGNDAGAYGACKLILG